MGSLVAGWDSPIMDEYTARVERNKSLTNEEINSFRRSKSPRENNEKGMNFSPPFLNNNERRRAATPFSRSHNDIWSIVHPRSVPNSPRTDESTDEITHESTDEITHKSNMTGDWWARSNSAFLNEAPRDVMHGGASNYTPQFNVARLATGNAKSDSLAVSYDHMSA